MWHLFSTWVESATRTNTDQVSVVVSETIVSKTQGALDGHLKDKPELQLPLGSQSWVSLPVSWLPARIYWSYWHVVKPTSAWRHHGCFVGGGGWNLIRSCIATRHLEQVVGVCIVYHGCLLTRRDGILLQATNVMALTIEVSLVRTLLLRRTTCVPTLSAH